MTGVICNEGFQDTVMLRPNYYRADDTLAHSRWTLEELATPVRCPMRLACGGGNATGDDSCNEGHSGHLCAKCAPGRYRSLANGCLECPEDDNIAVYTVVAAALPIVVFLLAIFYSHVGGRGAAPISSQSSGQKHRRRDTWGSKWLRWASTQLRVNRAQISTHVKILLGWVQVMSAFRHFKFVKWPPMFEVLLQYLDISFPLDLVPIDCIAKRVLTFYDMLQGFLVLPWIVSLALFTFATVAWALRGCPEAEGRRTGGDGHGSGASLSRFRARLATLQALCDSPLMWALHIWMLLVFYPLICSKIFATFTCISVKADRPDAIKLLRADPSLDCSTEEWRRWRAVALIAVGVYSIGIPCAFFMVVRHFASMRNTPSKAQKARQWRLRANLLLWSYKYSFWFVEGIDLVRKMLLASVVLVVMEETRVQLAFGTLITLTALCVTVQYQPYRAASCQQVLLAPTPSRCSLGPVSQHHAS